MRKVIVLSLLLLGKTYAYTSQAVLQYKSSLLINSIQLNNKPSYTSSYLIEYKGAKFYKPNETPVYFNNVVRTVSPRRDKCLDGSFEYMVIVNKSYFEETLISDSIRDKLKSRGFNIFNYNEYGVTYWGDRTDRRIVTYITKVTPFSYIASICKV